MRSNHPQAARRQRVNALLHSTGMADQKATILDSYGVASTKDLTDDQLDQLIAQLENLRVSKNEVPADVRKHRSIILTLLSDYGITANGRNWDNINRFLLDPRICGKVLYELSVEEMKNLAVKLRSIIRKKQQEQQHLDHLARNN